MCTGCMAGSWVQYVPWADPTHQTSGCKGDGVAVVPVNKAY